MKNKKGKNKLKIAVFLTFTAFLAAVGQTLFKAGLQDPAMLVLLITIGLAVYVVSTVYYLFALSKVHLSWAYGLTGLGYIFTVVLAYYALGESIPVMRWVGVAIIFIGVVLVGTS
jgi:multidrug transporter EmrE-like cation transporter